MKSSAYLVSLTLIALSLHCVGQSNATSDAVTSTTPVAYVYVGNGPVGNALGEKIFAFRVFPNGTATRVAGTPVTGPSLNLQVSSGHVYATDGKNVATYLRTPTTGAFHVSSVINGTAHNDTPTGSGVESLTLDRTAQSLYLGEIDFQGADNNAYAEYEAVSGGKLKFLMNSNINVNYGSTLVFSHNNLHAYESGCFFLGFQINGFIRASNGTLINFNPHPELPPDPSGDFLCPDTQATSAQNFFVLAFTDEESQPRAHSLITYHINADGTLGLVPGSAIEGTAVNAMRFDPTGVFMATVGQGIRIYKLSSAGKLSLVTTTATTKTFNDVRWDNFGHVYALSSTGVSVFTLKNNVLLQGAPILVSGAKSLGVLPVR
jgi:hypothetical protein